MFMEQRGAAREFLRRIVLEQGPDDGALGEGWRLGPGGHGIDGQGECAHAHNLQRVATGQLCHVDLTGR